MIKKSIFTLMLFVAMGCLSAQTLQLEWDGTVYPDGESFLCDTEVYGEYVKEFQVRNISNNALNVLFEKEILQDLEGVSNYFCWDNCYAPATMVSPRPLEIPANSLCDLPISVHALYDDAVFGDVIVKYSLYDAATPDQRITFTVKFRKSGAGIDEQVRYNLGHAYPNPASTLVRFDYELSASENASVSVYNLLGQEVLRQELNAMQGQVSFSVAELNEGIYFCNLKVNGQAVSTEKFVVKK